MRQVCQKQKGHEIVEREGSDSAVWLTWENQLRNQSMSAELGVPLCVIDYKAKRLKRYLVCTWRTFKKLYNVRPHVAFAQNPSVVLTLFLLFLRPFFRYTFISDAHFGGVVAFNGNSLFQKILDFCNRRADMVIVTNCEHAGRIERIGGKPFVCEDPLPDLSKYRRDAPSEPRANEKIVFFICSFDVDEPYKNAFEAADLLAGEGYKFFVSGNYRKVKIEPKDFPHVNFLGYILEHDFYSLLFKSDVVLDLTDHEGCMVCGAYEAMSAEKPLVTSDKRVLRAYFTHGTVFTKHDSQSIANSIRLAYAGREEKAIEIHDWKIQAIEEHQKKTEALRKQFILQ
jgi:glycosyltransferase involved in cell wall biosynthesis